MNAQKPTASARKLDAWAETRALDRRAIELLRSGRGYTLREAYEQARDELVKPLAPEPTSGA